jgi:hypothetical protein
MADRIVAIRGLCSFFLAVSDICFFPEILTTVFILAESAIMRCEKTVSFWKNIKAKSKKTIFIFRSI